MPCLSTTRVSGLLPPYHRKYTHTWPVGSGIQTHDLSITRLTLYQIQNVRVHNCGSLINKVWIKFSSILDKVNLLFLVQLLWIYCVFYEHWNRLSHNVVLVPFIVQRPARPLLLWVLKDTITNVHGIHFLYSFRFAYNVSKVSYNTMHIIAELLQRSSNCL